MGIVVFASKRARLTVKSTADPTMTDEFGTPIGTNYDKGEKPVGEGSYEQFDRLLFWVGNPKQAAQWYCLLFGFKLWKYKGLETGSRETVHYVIKKNKIVWEFAAGLRPYNDEYGKHHSRHGDAVKDVGFTVENIESCIEEGRKRGVHVVKDVWSESDEHGTLKMAAVATYGDTTHTLFDRSQYKGDYIPGYVEPRFQLPQLDSLPDTGLLHVDHCVGNQPNLKMEDVASWYERNLQFHRFWSVDDTQMHTEFSALRSVVMASWNENIKMPINEPAPGKRKSQIDEYVEYNGGAGVQHIAIRTNDIIKSIEALESRGVEFLKVPNNYYSNLRKRLTKSKVQIKESLDDLERLKILVDFDDNGYLLQLFTKPVQDRPTLFIEIIERHNFSGFGAGNFKALFECIEEEQFLRETGSKA